MAADEEEEATTRKTNATETRLSSEPNLGRARTQEIASIISLVGGGCARFG